MAANRGGKVIDSTEIRSNRSIVDVQPSKQHVPPARELVTIKFRSNWATKTISMIS